MKKEELIAKGYTDKQADEIIKLFGDEIKDSYVPKHRFDEVNTDLKNTKTQVTERDKQIEELKKFEGTAAELKTKVTELETQNKTKDAEYKTQIAAERKKNAVKLALLEEKDEKPYDVDMVMGLFDLDKVVMDENTGKITSGLKEQKDSLVKEKSFLFTPKTEEPKKPGVPGWTPKGNEPFDKGNPNPKGDEATNYGKSLASIKLSMMGIQPNANNTNTQQ